MRRKAWFLGKVVLVLAAVAVAAGVVMVLWNTVATTALAGAHPLDYVHALGLLVLCRGALRRLSRPRPGGRRAQWEKWQGHDSRGARGFEPALGSVRALAGSQ